MARRRPTGDDDSGLDSLLDTMFNVVGILIIVLVAVQLGAQKTVEKIASSVQVDPAQLAKLIEDLEAANQDKLKLQSDIEQLDPEQDLDELIQRLQSESNSQEAVLKSQQGDLQKALIAQKDAQEAHKKAAENQEKREALSKQLSTSLEEIAKLEAVLDDTPPREQLPAKVVNLPDPRPAPEGIQEAVFLVTGNQVYPVNGKDLRDNARKRAEYQAQRNLRKYVEDPAQGIDADKFVKDFNERPLQDEFFRAEMYASGRDPRLRLTPKGNGFSIREIQGARSRFRNIVGGVDPTKYYFRFFVLPDSFEAYVEARRVIDEMGYLSGWEPQGADWQYTTWVGGKVKFGPEPPPDPNKPKAPATPAAKPNVLD